MKYILFLVIFISGVSYPITCESLWDNDFQGYIIPETRLNQGDILVVIIDTSFSLSHIATQKDSKTITFEYTGGEYSNLFSFLPDINTGVDNSVKGDEKYLLKSDMVARIVSLDNNVASIEGSREIVIDGKKESITLSGYINAKDIDQQKRIPFSKIADARLMFQTFLSPTEYILKEEDIEDIITEIMTSDGTLVPEEGITTETAPVTPAEPVIESPVTGEQPLTEPPAPVTKTTPSLTQEKKKALFLMYLNRMIDILFK
ncbi:MAG: flagellar basal body L-ring protein FlgH [Spirochaetales bacterium]|nr:flagellar basal body L-ring protein FlgH [Spirochaetales bacterium]